LQAPTIDDAKIHTFFESTKFLRYYASNFAFFLLFNTLLPPQRKKQLTYEYLIEKKRLCEAENQRLAILQPLAQLVNVVFLFLHILASFFSCKDTKRVRHIVTHHKRFFTLCGCDYTNSL